MDASPPSPIAPGDHRAYMRYALALAKQSPPRPSNFRVGAVLVDAARNAVLATGYTLELPGNTHAEQCCLRKLAAQHGVEDEVALAALAAQDREALAAALPAALALYTTMEPCSQRLSGNEPCAQRVARVARMDTVTKVTVYVGVAEPATFVAHNTGRQTLAAAGVDVVHVPGLEEEILAVATAGHEKGTD